MKNPNFVAARVPKRDNINMSHRSAVIRGISKVAERLLRNKKNALLTTELVLERMDGWVPRIGKREAVATGIAFFGGSAVLLADSPPAIVERAEVGEFTIASSIGENGVPDKGKGIKVASANTSSDSEVYYDGEDYVDVPEVPKFLDAREVNELSAGLSNFYYHKYEVNGYVIETVTGDEWNKIVTYVDGEKYSVDTLNELIYELNGGYYYDKISVFTIMPQGTVSSGRDSEGTYSEISIVNESIDNNPSNAKIENSKVINLRKSPLEPGSDIKFIETEEPYAYAYIKVDEDYAYVLKINLTNGDWKCTEEIEGREEVSKVFGKPVEKASVE